MNIWCLGGGGSLGAFQAGVIKALWDKGERPDAIVGTSVGAVNAMGLSHGGPEFVWRMWEEIETKDVMRASWWKLLWAKGLYSLSPLHEFLKPMESVQKIPCYFAYVDLADGRLKYGTNDAKGFSKYVVGSSASPFVHEPWEGMVDGGVRDISPVEFALRLGCKKPVVVNNFPNRKNMPHWDGRWIWQLALRYLDVMLNEMKYNDLRGYDVELYCPDRPLPYPGMDFIPEYSKDMLSMGYDAGMVKK